MGSLSIITSLIKCIPVLCLLIFAILVSGCMGYQIIGPATPTPTANPTAQIIYVTPIPTPVLTVAPTIQISGNPVKSGDNISVDYIGSFDNGTIFDTSYPTIAQNAGIYDSNNSYVPISFVVGSGSVITGFDNAVIGMMVGETRS